MKSPDNTHENAPQATISHKSPSVEQLIKAAENDLPVASLGRAIIASLGPINIFHSDPSHSWSPISGITAITVMCDRAIFKRITQAIQVEVERFLMDGEVRYDIELSHKNTKVIIWSREQTTA